MARPPTKRPLRGGARAGGHDRGLACPSGAGAGLATRVADEHLAPVNFYISYSYIFVCVLSSFALR